MPGAAQHCVPADAAARRARSGRFCVLSCAQRVPDLSAARLNATVSRRPSTLHRTEATFCRRIVLIRQSARSARVRYGVDRFSPALECAFLSIDLQRAAMALIHFSLILSVQPSQAIGLSLSGRVPTTLTPPTDTSSNHYRVVLQLSAENPHPMYDGDAHFDQRTLAHTRLVAQDTGFSVSHKAFETVRQQVLAFLAEWEHSGWIVTYEQAYFQQLVLVSNVKWHFQTLPSSQILFQIWLLHPQKLPYSLESELSILNWMRQAAAAG